MTSTYEFDARKYAYIRNAIATGNDIKVTTTTSEFIVRVEIETDEQPSEHTGVCESMIYINLYSADGVELLSEIESGMETEEHTPVELAATISSFIVKGLVKMADEKDTLEWKIKSGYAEWQSDKFGWGASHDDNMHEIASYSH